ncbi:hypothetical protein ACQV2T_07900 [Facklamia sp. P13069]|uniref:hypothetical protein n=1 Tax=Facklamia sp. P13069 TaxID=3421954 RepID=UPI003D171F6D
MYLSILNLRRSIIKIAKTLRRSLSTISREIKSNSSNIKVRRRKERHRKSKYCFVTLAERRSRYYIAILVENRKSENVTSAIINALKDLVKTITFDRGEECSEFEQTEEELGCKTYFYDP